MRWPSLLRNEDAFTEEAFAFGCLRFLYNPFHAYEPVKVSHESFSPVPAMTSLVARPRSHRLLAVVNIGFSLNQSGRLVDFIEEKKTWEG